MGFLDANECPRLSNLAHDYLRKSKGCDDSIYEFFANEPEAESLCVKLIEEFEKCILGYFAFHWGQASIMISQVLLQSFKPNISSQWLNSKPELSWQKFKKRAKKKKKQEEEDDNEIGKLALSLFHVCLRVRSPFVRRFTCFINVIYFSFEWQVLSVESEPKIARLKDGLLAATR